MSQMLYDVFISHASEDKDSFVRPLVNQLKENHVEVWYDEFTLTLGDSLRRSIDRGLSKSRFGIVVISPAFMSKEWPQWELDGLVARQNDERRKLILPVWHNVTKREVLEFCPALADRVAGMSSQGLQALVDDLLKVIKPKGSTLVIARDRLVELGLQTPVVTDDWWLDVAEFSASNDVEDTFQEAMGWGHWGFPLPPKSEDPWERGERLALAAAQKSWQQSAVTHHISQLTHPEQVWEFVEENPGLLETVMEHSAYLAAYAPQLTIPGYGGPLEDVFERWYSCSVSERKKKRECGDIGGTALTTNGLVPACDESVAFRHPTLGDYNLAHLACWFVQGELLGPTVKVYETIDYAVWLLSDASKWLPEHIRNALTIGVAQWAAWAWVEPCNRDTYGYLAYQPGPSSGVLFESLFDALECGADPARHELSEPCRRDILERFSFSVQLMNLPESPAELSDLFLAHGFIRSWLEKHQQRRNGSKRRPGS